MTCTLSTVFLAACVYLVGLVPQVGLPVRLATCTPLELHAAPQGVWLVCCQNPSRRCTPRGGVPAAQDGDVDIMLWHASHRRCLHFPPLYSAARASWTPPSPRLPASRVAYVDVHGLTGDLVVVLQNGHVGVVSDGSTLPSTRARPHASLHWQPLCVLRRAPTTSTSGVPTAAHSASGHAKLQTSATHGRAAVATTASTATSASTDVVGGSTSTRVLPSFRGLVVHRHVLVLCCERVAIVFDLATGAPLSEDRLPKGTARGVPPLFVRASHCCDSRDHDHEHEHPHQPSQVPHGEALTPPQEPMVQQEEVQHRVACHKCRRWKPCVWRGAGASGLLGLCGAQKVWQLLRPSVQDHVRLLGTVLRSLPQQPGDLPAEVTAAARCAEVAASWGPSMDGLAGLKDLEHALALRVSSGDAVTRDPAAPARHLAALSAMLSMYHLTSGVSSSSGVGEGGAGVDGCRASSVARPVPDGRRLEPLLTGPHTRGEIAALAVATRLDNPSLAVGLLHVFSGAGRLPPEAGGLVARFLQQMIPGSGGHRRDGSAGYGPEIATPSASGLSQHQQQLDEARWGVCVVL